MTAPTIDLNTVWFVLVGVLFTGYAMLDGFDLGVGALHLLTRKDEHRRILLNAIGPVWDGNEVWLVTGGGALFAAFPVVYASVFSGFYVAVMALLLALIFRAVAIEFRSKHPSPRWRRIWDVGFAVGSALAGVLFGVALGNIAWGVPLGPDLTFRASFASLLHPYALLVGVTTFAFFTMHGALYLLLKTTGELHAQVRGWIRPAIVFFILTYVLLSLVTLLYVPHLSDRLRATPALGLIVVLTVLAVVNIARQVAAGRDGRAFLSSCAAIVGLMLVFGVEMFPNLVVANPAIENSLTIYNAASSPATLRIMLIIAAIGVPLVLAYTAGVHWLFRGKVVLDASSY